ncbi:hypothetical protein O7600_28045 [Micromonospora sp. WMMA1998]|uniref:caspase, EACC1-associated type n=1 Tax=Micromonospora sp. WMMA1998 TaxID=3015167 RepID=UPI00248B5BEA|nr:hypothetical protein [Micromonospora sp. WMMA1998]WBC14883.1 hypothetical protein O7600_28045 [Micromonospora sp. WMMA1998]
MTDLTGDGVRVLLLGTATHRGPLLNSVPAVARTLPALRDSLVTRCGVQPELVRMVLDPPTSYAMATAIAETASAATTVLVIYYVGHGLIGPHGELHLAATDTDRLTPGLTAHQALPVGAIREVVTDCAATSVVVVLDCCFSGRADVHGSRPAQAPTFTMPAAQGVYLMTSAERLALAPADATYTTFSGALMELLDQGDPRGPAQLRLDDVYDYLFRTLRARQAPLPQRQAAGRSGDLLIAANVAQPETVAREEEPPAAGPCPYPSLEAFSVDEAPLFYGREEATARLLTAAAESVDECQPLVLVGASGTGKTSLLHAGLLAALHTGAPPLRQAASWPSIVLTPGDQPVERLVARLGAAGSTGTAERLRADPAQAAELAVDLLADRPGARLVVVVDQLEELFTLCPDETEQHVFLGALAALAVHSLVVLALRADFYGRAAEHPHLAAALRENQFLVEPMSTDELRAAIERPAAAVGLIQDDGLADLMLHELGAGGFARPPAGALPLLAHALWATWRRRSGSRMTVVGYRATGGIAQAVASTADETYAQLDPAAQAAARRMLPRLVQVGDETADTARPTDRVVLLRAASDEQAAQRALDQLTRARLVTVDRDTVRLSHEALLHAWPLLGRWIDADRDWLRTSQQLAADAARWVGGGRDPSLLYRGNQLAGVRDRAAGTGLLPSLEPESADFLAAAERQERRRARRVRAVLATLVVLLLLTTTGGIGALTFQRQAVRERDVALARLLTTEVEALRSSQPGLARQLGLVAHRVDPRVGAAAVFTAQQLPGVYNAGAPAVDLAVDAGERLLAISTGNAIALRDLRSGGRGAIPDVRSGPIALTRSGNLLAAAVRPEDDRDPDTGDGHQVRLWVVDGPTRTRPAAVLPLADEPVNTVAFSPDAQILVVGTSAGTIRAWDVRAAEAPRPLPGFPKHKTWIESAAFAPNGRLLATVTGDGRVTLWDLTDPARVRPLTTLAGTPLDRVPSERTFGAGPEWRDRLAFDGTGRYLAMICCGSGREQIRVWALDDARRPRPVTESRTRFICGDIKGLAFRADAAMLAVGCGGEVQLWRFIEPDPAKNVDGELVDAARLIGHKGQSVAYLSRSDKVLHAGANGVELWSTANVWRPGALASMPLAPYGFGVNLAFNPVGPPLLAIAGVGTQVWDLTDRRTPRIRRATNDPRGFGAVSGVTFSPDGTLLAVAEPADEGLRVRLRRTDDLEVSLSEVGGLSLGAIALAVSPDGRTLAVADNSEYRPKGTPPPTVKLYDISDPRRPHRYAVLPVEAWNLAFAPDGRWLATFASESATLWDLADSRRPAPRDRLMLTAGSSISNGVFRPDGRLLLVGDGMGTLRAWPVSRDGLGDEPRSTLRRTGSNPNRLAISPDGRTVAFPDYSGQPYSSPEWLAVWDFTDASTPTFQYGVGAGTSADNVGFSPDGATLAVVTSGMTTNLWDLDADRVAPGLCDGIGDRISRAEWSTYVPGLPYEAPCG